MPQKYTVQSPEGKKVTFEWSDSAPPTEKDIDEILGVAKGQDSSGVSSGVKTSQGWMNEPATALYPLEPGNPFSMTPYQTTPNEMAKNAGNAIEFGLPLVSGTGLASIPISAGLGFLGSLANRQIQSSAEGQREPIGTSTQQSIVPGLFAGGGQALGVGIGKGLTKMMAPFEKQVNSEMLAVSKARGLKPTASEILDEKTFGANTLMQIESALPMAVGTGAYKNIREFNNVQLKKYAKSIMDNFAPQTDPDKLATLLAGDVGKTKGFFREVQSALYGKVDESMANLPKVPTNTIKEFAQKVFLNMAPGRRALYGSAGKQPSAVMGLMETIDQLPETIAFSDASQYVSDLKRLSGYTNNQLKDPLQGSAGRLASLFESSMEKTAKGAGSNVYDLYRRASSFTKTGHKIFDDAIISRIAETEPEKLGATFFRPETTEALRKMKAALSPQAFMQYHKGLLESLRTKMGPDSFKRAMRDGMESLLDGKVFNKVEPQAPEETTLKGVALLERLKGYGSGTLETAFGKESADALMQFARVSSRIETKVSKPGIWGVGQLMTGMGAIASGNIGSGAFVMLGPAALSKLLTSKVGRTLLTEGYRVSPGTRQAAILASRVASFLASEGVAGYQRNDQTFQAPTSSTAVGQ
jgi:hypothetical protein